MACRRLRPAGDDIDRFNIDLSDRYLFSRSGRPVALSVWIVPRSWLVAICSGATLLVGFLAMFSRLRFRTTWVAIAGFGLLAAVLVQPSVTVVLLQSAVVGAVLTLSGIVDREPHRSIAVTVDRRSRGRPAGEPASERFVATVTGQRRFGRLDGGPRARTVDDGFRRGADRGARGRMRGARAGNGRELSHSPAPS